MSSAVTEWGPIRLLRNDRGRFSDVTGELDAAAATGMRTGLLLRPGNRPAEPGPHPTLTDFRSLV